MGLSLSKPFQIFLCDIFEKKYDAIQLVAVVKVIVEDHCEFEESTDKESQEYSGEDFDIID